MKTNDDDDEMSPSFTPIKIHTRYKIKHIIHIIKCIKSKIYYFVCKTCYLNGSDYYTNTQRVFILLISIIFLLHEIWVRNKKQNNNNMPFGGPFFPLLVVVCVLLSLHIEVVNVPHCPVAVVIKTVRPQLIYDFSPPYGYRPVSTNLIYNNVTKIV